MAQTTSNGQDGPTPEALAFSASLFTSSISSWIPTNFGLAKSDSEKAKEFELAIREERGGDRLGLGHPLLDEPRKLGQSSSRGGGGAGLAGLSRKLELEKRKGKERANQNGMSTTTKRGDGDDEDDEDEGESRSRSLGKGKPKARGGVVDMFGGKKNKKPAASTSMSASASASPAPIPPTPTSQAEQSSQPSSSTQLQPATTGQGSSSVQPTKFSGNDDQSPSTVDHISTSNSPPSRSNPSTPLPISIGTSSPGGSGTFPFQGPIALKPLDAKNNLAKKRSADEVEMDDEDTPVTRLEGNDAKQTDEVESKAVAGQHSAAGEGEKALSRSQLRREKRKKAKLSSKAE
ncbi:hypothetical protein CI109_100539 [Kwoniella shandongensis]|uniref:Uncharacterized protein n=1 Tax=Kwoniella shandongensis TaxID=1734106 RepID=A0A5M6C0N1_9TREE|nr:uncharacterized protein CI109_003540 [Kwoniella shandongensis]KAA5528251.1 hypothetical protein CI109_003540 [Kwoniella shandongensis]